MCRHCILQAVTTTVWCRLTVTASHPSTVDCMSLQSTECVCEQGGHVATEEVQSTECVCEQGGHVATEEVQSTECVCEQVGHVATEEGCERTRVCL